MNKAHFVSGAIVFLGLTIVYSFVSSYMTSAKKEIATVKTSFKSQAELLKISPQSQNMPSLKKSDIASENTNALNKSDILRNIEDQEDDLKDLFELDQRSFQSNLENIVEIQSNVREFKKSNGIAISRYEYMKPEVLYALSVMKEVSVDEVVRMSDEEIGLTTDQLNILHNFVSSSDFRILLKQNKLTSDFFDFSHLKMVYSNKREIEFKNPNDTALKDNIEDVDEDRND